MQSFTLSAHLALVLQARRLETLDRHPLDVSQHDVPATKQRRNYSFAPEPPPLSHVLVIVLVSRLQAVAFSFLRPDGADTFESSVGRHVLVLDHIADGDQRATTAASLTMHVDFAEVPMRMDEGRAGLYCLLVRRIVVWRRTHLRP